MPMEFYRSSLKFSEYIEKRNQLSSSTPFMTPSSEPQKTQNISGSLSVVTSIVISHKHYHKEAKTEGDSLDKMSKQTTKRGCTHNKCMPPGRILFNHMAPMAEKHLTHRIEIVERSAARCVQNDYHYTSSVTNMLRELKWSTLEQRRNQASLTMLDKIHTL